MPRKGRHLTAGKGHDMFGGKRRFVYGCGAHTSTRSTKCMIAKSQSLWVERTKSQEPPEELILVAYRRSLSCTLALQLMSLVGGTSKPSRDLPNVDR